VGAEDPPVAAPVDDPVPVAVPGEPPAGELGVVVWLEVVELGEVVDDELLWFWLDDVEPALLAVGALVEPDDEPSVGVLEDLVGALGATPPALITVEMPPVG
jgi:hypothetical protein